MNSSLAPGIPGIPPTWCSSDKDLVGTAVGPARLWYTLGHGIINEIYYPRIDIPQIRDLGFIVADGQGFWVEGKRLLDRDIDLPAPGIPLPTITHHHPRFSLILRVCPDSERDVLLIDLDLEGDEELLPYVLLAPRLGGSGRDNTAWAQVHRGRKLLWADQGTFGLALSASDSAFHDAYGRTSVGHVGASDLWQDFAVNGRMSWEYDTAGPGNVALAGELPRHARLALGMATSKEAAATLAVAALTQSFDALIEQQTTALEQWHREREIRAPVPKLPRDLTAQYRTSAMVLKCHRDKTFSGAMVASLSVPWGNRGEERGALLGMLREAASTIEYGVSVSKIADTADGATVSFNDRSTAVFDLIVGRRYSLVEPIADTTNPVAVDARHAAGCWLPVELGNMDRSSRAGCRNAVSIQHGQYVLIMPQVNRIERNQRSGRVVVVQMLQ